MSLKRKKQWCTKCLLKYDAQQIGMDDLARLHSRLKAKLERQRGYLRLARDFLSIPDRVDAACEAKITRDRIVGTEMAMRRIVQDSILESIDRLTQDSGDGSDTLED